MGPGSKASGADRQQTRRLRREIEHALGRGFDPTDVLPRLARLVRIAPPASDEGIFANKKLAELLVEHHPWRAAIHARRALAHCSTDDRAWAILAFSHTLLGNFRSAAAAYGKAVACAPTNPWYAHNLGHLFDVALGQPKRALPWLRAAFEARSDNSEIVASYVHALACAGQVPRAREVLDAALVRFESRELAALARWLDAGAPSRRVVPATTPAPRPAPPAPPAPKAAGERHLVRRLEQGLRRLPFDARQRERALVLARDLALIDRRNPSVQRPREPSARHLKERRPSVVAQPGHAPGDAGPRRRASDTSREAAGLAAAVAYAIVYVDHVPLSHAEVAAPFRVAVSDLRGRFAELRAKLDLIRGDARYTTPRR